MDHNSRDRIPEPDEAYMFGLILESIASGRTVTALKVRVTTRVGA